MSERRASAIQSIIRDAAMTVPQTQALLDDWNEAARRKRAVLFDAADALAASSEADPAASTLAAHIVNAVAPPHLQVTSAEIEVGTLFSERREAGVAVGIAAAGVLLTNLVDIRWSRVSQRASRLRVTVERTPRDLRSGNDDESTSSQESNPRIDGGVS